MAAESGKPAPPPKSKLAISTPADPPALTYPTEKSPLPVRIIESEANAKRDEARDARSTQRDEADLGAQIRMASAAEEQLKLGWATFVLSLLGAIFIAWTLLETRRSAKAAVRAADAATTSVAVAEATAVNQLRAYVSCAPNHIYSLSTLEPVQIRCEVKNHGVTPAHDVRLSGMVRLWPHPLPSDWDFKDAKPRGLGSKSTLHANQSPLTLKASAERTYSQQEFEQFLSGKGVAIYCCGVIEYRDAFNNERVTRFCNYLVPSASVAAMNADPNASSGEVDVAFAVSPLHNDST